MAVYEVETPFNTGFTNIDLSVGIDDKHEFSIAAFRPPAEGIVFAQVFSNGNRPFTRPFGLAAGGMHPTIHYGSVEIDFGLVLAGRLEVSQVAGKSVIPLANVPLLIYHGNPDSEHTELAIVLPNVSRIVLKLYADPFRGQEGNISMALGGAPRNTPWSSTAIYICAVPRNHLYIGQIGSLVFESAFAGTAQLKRFTEFGTENERVEIIKGKRSLDPSFPIYATSNWRYQLEVPITSREVSAV